MGPPDEDGIGDGRHRIRVNRQAVRIACCPPGSSIGMSLIRLRLRDGSGSGLKLQSVPTAIWIRSGRRGFGGILSAATRRQPARAEPANLDLVGVHRDMQDIAIADEYRECSGLKMDRRISTASSAVTAWVDVGTESATSHFRCHRSLDDREVETVQRESRERR